MKADTQRYVALQQIYRHKATQDVAVLTAELARVLHASGLSPDAISHDEISVFAKHASVLKVFRSRRLSDEYDAPLGLGQHFPW